MLARQNAVAEYTLGKESECVLFFTRYGEEKAFTSAGLPPLRGVPEHVMSFYDEDGEDEYQFFALRIIWKKEKFNDLIVACANDQTGSILFANTATRSIYAPYDGGADLFFPSAQDVPVARSRFAKWLSARADGL
ncbi:hypothetical protein GCM10025770_30580 [Viridibacterium curvum]|uniref:DUF3885 domain-containing protein n=2 Tax=Viridibacterium curvum TaxID=1101404 RepID=A0ABP9QXU8_9RHOO